MLLLLQKLRIHCNLTLKDLSNEMKIKHKWNYIEKLQQKKNSKNFDKKINGYNLPLLL